MTAALPHDAFRHAFAHALIDPMDEPARWQADAWAAQPGFAVYRNTVAKACIDALAANAGHGLGRAFLDQPFDEILHVINTNITGTVRLVHLIGRTMRARGRGRILFTGSIAGLMPGSFQAVYNGSKAFVDSFSLALRNELKGSGVSVTVLMPGPTDTRFFERADMMDTKVAQGDKASLLLQPHLSITIDVPSCEIKIRV
jgi:short-subunit dehydrogenase